MAKIESMYITPEDVLWTEVSDFFDFQFKMVGGHAIECTYKWEKIDENIGAWLFLIREHYCKLKERNKMLKKKSENKTKAMEEQLANFEHKKHCYCKAIAQHNADKNFYKTICSAFWQLAKQNEEVKPLFNRENTQFNV